LKDNLHLVITIGKFSSQLYITIQFRRVISSWHLFQRLNFSRVILKTNTYRTKKSCYALKRVERAKSHKVYITLVKKINKKLFKKKKKKKRKKKRIQKQIEGKRKNNRKYKMFSKRLKEKEEGRRK